MKTARRSLRHSLAAELRARILAGEWRPGDRLPSEPELARRRTVSRSSMRAAITVLEEDGLVSRKHGSGTYVTHSPTVANDLGRNLSVSSLIKATGMQPGTVDLTFGAVPAPPAVAAALEVAEGELVSELRRVRTADGRRVVDVTDWCRTDHLAPDELPDLPGGSIYAALAERGLAVVHGVAQLTPQNADGEVAQPARRPARDAAAHDRPGRPHGRRRRSARRPRVPPRRRVQLPAPAARAGRGGALSPPLVVGVDVGSQGTCAEALELDGTLVASTYEPHALSYPQAGWAEQDPRAVDGGARRHAGAAARGDGGARDRRALVRLAARRARRRRRRRRPAASRADLVRPPRGGGVLGGGRADRAGAAA